jgi:hypothetical protein
MTGSATENCAVTLDDRTLKMIHPTPEKPKRHRAHLTIV